MKSMLLVTMMLVSVTQAYALTILDLPTVGSGSVNSAFFSLVDLHGQGTGNLDPFVRLHDNQGDHDGIDVGYNADADSTMPDTKPGPWTHNITLGDIPIVSFDGGTYYELLLDVNETGSQQLLSVEVLRLFTSATAVDPADTYAALTAVAGTPNYDLDVGADGDSTVYCSGVGSGIADVFVYIPTSFFAGVLDSYYLYLYAEMGITGGDYGADDGYEEWGVRVGGEQVPDGGMTLVMLGAALAGIGLISYRKR
jgi:hypothetical protein